MADPADQQERLRNAERLKFFTDAVVAIAMTLLILPLLESVSEAASEGFDTHQWISEQGGQLFAFALSFAVIASLWVGHERLFDHVARWSTPLLLLNIAWMFSINLLAVMTAVVGAIDTDRLQLLLYIGAMLVSTLLMTGMTVVVRRDSRLWARESGPTLGSVTAEVAQVVLYAVAMALSMVRGVGFFAMFVLFLTGPLQAVLQRAASRLSPRRP
ncbi:MAG: hypothetical protein JWO46_3277 [Nocardioidaceae bacterium]|nr:hypothetical protein [Nocardioidaceae bacterium]